MEILTERDRVLLRLVRSKLSRTDIAKVRDVCRAKGTKAARGIIRTLTGLTVPGRVVRTVAGTGRDDSLEIRRFAWNLCGYARVRPYLATVSNGSYRRGHGGGRQDAQERAAWAAARGAER
jgi:hypothetical protein